MALFLADGFARFTLDELAARLHCSKSTLYQLAGSKDALVRAVAVHFFREATGRVEAALAGAPTATARVETYLRAIGAELRPGSERFFADLSGPGPAGEVYRRNTDIAAARVGEMLAEGAETGEFRPVRAAFVTDLVAAQMERIQQGRVREATGVDDADAYEALADLVLHGVASGR